MYSVYLRFSRIDSIEKLRDKLDALRNELKNKSTLRDVYVYAFDFAKEKEEQKSIGKCLFSPCNGKHPNYFAKLFWLQI